MLASDDEIQSTMIQISPENQGFIDELVASGRFKSRDAAIEEAIHRLRAEFQPDGDDDSRRLSAVEWCEHLQAWAASHRKLPLEADDSRESIYAGRGE